MFSHFDGVVSEKQAGSLVIDCGGVGHAFRRARSGRAHEGVRAFERAGGRDGAVWLCHA